MPYSIRRKGRHYQVVNSETGDVKAQSTSRAKAEKQLRILKGIERDWKPQQDGSYTRQINGKNVTLHVTGGKTSGAKR